MREGEVGEEVVDRGRRGVGGGEEGEERNGHFFFAFEWVWFWFVGSEGGWVFALLYFPPFHFPPGPCIR